jgi:hypothetical protein
MSLFAEDVPESNGRAGEREFPQLELLDAVSDLRVVLSRLADAGEIAFDVGSKDRHTDAAESLGHYLQRDSLAGAGGAGYEAVTIGHVGQNYEFVLSFSDQKRIRHGLLLEIWSPAPLREIHDCKG